MEALFVYLIKSAALMSAFFLAYQLFLRKETFFKSNRWYLLAGLVTSVVLPLVTFKKVVWVEPQPLDYTYSGIAVPLSSQIPVVVPAEPVYETDWLLVILGMYLLGVAVFLIKFVADCYSVYTILKGKSIQKESKFKLLDVLENVSPFSFFNYIVYNSSMYTRVELQSILEHEKVHCRQKHTADVLLARLFCIFFWWNPMVWFHKKAILQNLEFIADSEASKNLEDKKAYQFTLLKITTHENCLSITNHFYQSLIKKRIVMLNKNQSDKRNSWKYALIIPLLLAFIFYFQVQVVAQERNSPVEQRGRAEIEVVVDKNSTDFYLNAEAKRLKEEHGITLKFSGIKRNNNHEIIAIKTSFKDKDGNSGKSAFSGTEPIAPFRFYKDTDGNGKSIAGIGTVTNSAVAFRTFMRHIPNAPDSPEAPEMPEAPEAPELAEALEDLEELSDLNGERMEVQTIVKDGKTQVIINGEVVAEVDVDQVLADLDPIFINGIDVLRTGKKGGANAVYIDTDKITKEALEDAHRQMERAHLDMERARPQMERAHREMAKAHRQLRRAPIANQSHEEARREIDEARREAEEARREVEEAKREVEQAKREVEQAKRELELERKR
ncbi:MAG TPA: M56 family metallopeptidase [Flavobacterium sp.]|jgi:hypothetical protein